MNNIKPEFSTEREECTPENLENIGNDGLAEATNDKLHWNDPGMDDFESGWEDFPIGTRVEVRTPGNIWRKGTVVETIRENDRGIVVECDEQINDNMDFYEGHGVMVMVYMNTRRGILSNIRTIDEPRREIVIPQREPIKLEGKTRELLGVIETAVQNSNGHLRIAFNEEDESNEFCAGAQRFLKFNGKRLGRDIELYGFMGNDIVGWENTLVIFFEEILSSLKSELPESYVKATEALRTLGESVYPEDILQQWRDLF